MGKGGAQQQVTDYYMSIHLGICNGPVTLRGIQVDQKSIWSGSADAATVLSINQRELFGGPKKEGGVGGTVYWLPGTWNQFLPDELARKLGRESGADCPGFRGVASLFFTNSTGGVPGGGIAAELVGAFFGLGISVPGFYWTSNTPYLKTIWATIGRGPVTPRSWPGWDYKVEFRTTFSAFLPGDNAAATNVLSGPAGIIKEPSGDTHSVEGLTRSEFFTVIGPHDGLGDGVGEWQAHLTTAAIVNPGGSFPHNEMVLEVFFHHWTQDLPVLVGTSPSTTGRVATVDWDNDLAWESLRNAHTIITSDLIGDDANPAAIIFECLTNTEWGMGAPASIVDLGSFDTCAATLADEGLGLSLLWTRESDIESFVGEIIDHIQATVFVNPRTGLLTIKLIRGDYDPATLPVFNPDNAVLSNFQRKAWGEITNEVVVTWTNPVNEQDETVTAQDLASIAMQGAVVSDSRNYYGVRNSDLAMKLAVRDLGSASAPMASCDVEIDRSAWDLLPGDVRKVTWPEHGLSEIVFRVGPVDYGKPGDPTIKATLIEDVFGIDSGDYVSPPASSWEDPSTPPAPMTWSRTITLPAFVAANALSAAGLDAPAYPEVLAGILASSDATDTISYDAVGPRVTPDGSSVQDVHFTGTVLGRATLTEALAAEAESEDVGFSGAVGNVAPSVAVFAMIGGDETPEEAMEIALITAADSDSFTLSRGLLDTIPRDWDAATPVWFVSIYSNIADPDLKADGEDLTYKLLSRTSLGVLALDDAPELTGTASGRPYYPNRPANVTANGIGFPVGVIDIRGEGGSSVPMAWANRNRLLEGAAPMAWTDDTMTPETGQTTVIEVRAIDGTILTTHDGLSGTSFDVPYGSFGDDAIGELRTYSARTDDQGDFTSLQYFSHWVQVADITFDSDAHITFDSTIPTMDNG